MKYLITYCFLFVFSLGLSAQTDTITFHYYDNYNELVYGVRPEGKPVYLQGKINPNYETIFERRDSTLFTGFLKMLSGEIRTPLDSFPPSNSIYKVTNGIPRLTKSISYSYHHPDTKKTFCWKAYETVVKDSSKISLSFYPNGKIKTERNYRFLSKDTLSHFNSYDSTGVLQMSNEKKGELFDGLFTFIIKDSLYLTLRYKRDILESIESKGIVFFDQRRNIISEDMFISKLSQEISLSWGFIFIDNCIAMYLTKEQSVPYITVEERGLTPARRKILNKKLEKQCTTTPKRH